MRQHSLRLDDELMQAVDSKRGLIPRNTWIVAAIKVALGESIYDGLTDTGPGPQKPRVPETERSPEPQPESRSARALSKPPLRRPIIQKRGK